MKSGRRRNKGQLPDASVPALSPKSSDPTVSVQTPQPAKSASQALATEAAKQPAKPDAADIKASTKAADPEATVNHNTALDKQKAGRRKNGGNGEQTPGQSKTAQDQVEQPKQAQQVQRQQGEPRVKTAPASTAAPPAAAHTTTRSGPGLLPGALPMATSQNAARDSRSEAQAAQPSSQLQPGSQQQQQQKQQQLPQQQRHAPAAQHGARPAPSPANPQPPRSAATGRGAARQAANYSAAVSGLVHSTAALHLTQPAEQPASPAQPNGPAAVVPADEQPPKPAAAAAAAAPAANQVQHRKQQQQSRQPPQKQQQAQQQQQQAPVSLPASDGLSGRQAYPQQQQVMQQQGFLQHAGASLAAQYPWDMHTPAVCTPHQAAHLNIPTVDWSFQAPAGAAAPGPAPVFSRTASAGNLANQNAWPLHGAGHMAPPPVSAAQGHAAAASRGESFDGATPRHTDRMQQPQQAGAAAGNRASTSGFVVASSSPGRPRQNGMRAGQGSDSVRPSAGILSVQMNTAGQTRPPSSHALPAPGAAQQPGAQMPFPAMGSSGQNMGVSLPSSIANNIWAVGDAQTASLGTSAEQRPHMWASPSRNSPMRRAGGYNGPGVARQPSLSQATEIRRVAEASGLCCPITKDLMSDPVVLISDGYTYERAAITKWLEHNETSPTTKAPLQHKDMVPNLTMRSAIQLLIPSANSQRLFASQLERRHI